MRRAALLWRLASVLVLLSLTAIVDASNPPATLSQTPPPLATLATLALTATPTTPPETSAETAACPAKIGHGENVADAIYYVGQITLITVVVSFVVAYMIKMTARLLQGKQPQA